MLSKSSKRIFLISIYTLNQTLLERAKQNVCTAHGEDANIFKHVTSKWTRPLDRPSNRWEDNIRIETDVKEK
jgi:hypothetical protein